MAIAHFAFGAGMTTLLVPTVWYPRTVVLAGGGWAMGPDVHWVSPVAEHRLQQLHHSSPLTDVFWLHRTWDRMDPTDAKSIAAAMLVFLLVTTAIAEWRQYRALEAVRVTYEAYADSEPSE